MQGPVFLSTGPDAKLDMLNTFDLDKPFDLHLDPPSSENLPLHRITQDGKDFYLANMEPREWLLPTPRQIMEQPHQMQQQQPVTQYQKYRLIHSNQEKLDYTPGSYILYRLQF